MVKWIRNGTWKIVPSIILNANVETKKLFLEEWDKGKALSVEDTTKCVLASIQYLRACIQ